MLFLACCKHWTLIPEAFSDGSFFPWLPIVSTQRSANQYSADSSRGTFHHLWRPFSVQLSSLVLCPENPHVFIPHMLNSISLTQGLLHAHFLCHSLETLRASSTLVQSHSPCLFPLSQNYCPLLLNVLYPENHLSHEYFAFLLVIFGGRVILVSVILSCLVHSFKSHKFLQHISVSCHKLMHPNSNSPEAISTLLIVSLTYESRDFFSDPVIKTLHFQCKGHGLSSLVRELRSHMSRDIVK